MAEPRPVESGGGGADMEVDGRRVAPLPQIELYLRASAGLVDVALAVHRDFRDSASRGRHRHLSFEMHRWYQIAAEITGRNVEHVAPLALSVGRHRGVDRRVDAEVGRGSGAGNRVGIDLIGADRGVHLLFFSDGGAGVDVDRPLAETHVDVRVELGKTTAHLGVCRQLLRQRQGGSHPARVVGGHPRNIQVADDLGPIDRTVERERYAADLALEIGASHLIPSLGRFGIVRFDVGAKTDTLGQRARRDFQRRKIGHRSITTHDE